MYLRIGVLVLVTRNLSVAITISKDARHEELQIEPNGDIISVKDGIAALPITAMQDAKHAPPAAMGKQAQQDHVHDANAKKTSLVRQEGKIMTMTHGRRSLKERRQWAKRHGNLAATHRLVARAFAWSQLYTIKVPKTMTNTVIMPATIVFMVLGCGLTICQCLIQSRRSQGGEAADADGGSGGTNRETREPVEHDFSREPEGLDEDIYGMGVAALIRDSQRFALGTECFALRLSRLLISLLTLLFTMSLQIFLLYEMKELVTSASTSDARGQYDKYEIWMYGNDKSKMTKLSDGQVRGVPEHFDIKRFKDLDDDLKDSICQVPLSQPAFFIAVLLVWTLVCFVEMRRTFNIGGSLLVATPTISSMKESLKETEELDDEAVVVVGITAGVKIAAVFLIIIPRAIVSVTLLWLGCRWLTGTFGFSDVLQNAVALEFILLLKDIFYDCVTPAHNKAETANTLIKPFTENERPSSSVFLGSFTWGVIAIVFVLCYIGSFQQVLPDYQWDVHDACVSYLADVEKLTPDS